eukprot:jgi/Hompol1/449/HPOL_004196-RA
MAAQFTALSHLVPLPLVGPIINIAELIIDGIQGLRANKNSFRAFGDRITLFVATLNEQAKVKGPDGNVPRALAENIDAIKALLESIEEYVVRISKMNTLRQFLAHAENLQLRIAFDQHSIVNEIRKDQIEALEAIQKLQVNEQMLETLVDIGRTKANDFHEDLRPELEKALRNAEKAISRSSTRTLTSPKDWTVEPYEVVINYKKKLGHGGYSNIYKAVWNRRDVAVKVVSASNNPNATDIIEQEAGIWYTLNHPNILKLWRVCLNSDEPFLVIDLMSADVPSYLHDRPSTDLPSRVFIISQIAAGMRYLHHQLSQPIIHGDLKANNVLVGFNGEVAITDFNMAHLKSLDNTRSDRHTRAMRWIAPEKYRPGYTPSTPADVFAFAMTCIEILTDDLPFPTERFGDKVMGKIVHGERPERPVGITDSLWQLIQECWHDNPNERPTFETIVRLVEQEELKPLPAEERRRNRRSAKPSPSNAGQSNDLPSCRVLK